MCVCVCAHDICYDLLANWEADGILSEFRLIFLDFLDCLLCAHSTDPGVRERDIGASREVQVRLAC